MNTIKFYRIPLFKVAIIGLEGSGKTTLARYLYSIYRWGRHNPNAGRIVKSIYFMYDKEKREELFKAIAEEKEANYLYIVIDDISFSITHHERNFLNRLAKIRHSNKHIKRWVFVYIMHYSKGTIPFLRQANAKILTSLVEPESIEQLKYSFTVNALWDYYRVYTSAPDKHVILVNWMGNLFISKFKRPKARCWDIVVNGEECV